MLISLCLTNSYTACHLSRGTRVHSGALYSRLEMRKFLSHVTLLVHYLKQFRRLESPPPPLPVSKTSGRCFIQTALYGHFCATVKKDNKKKRTALVCVVSFFSANTAFSWSMSNHTAVEGLYSFNRRSLLSYFMPP